MTPPPIQQPTDERIIHAALTLIAQNGLGGVTMRAIAQEADIARQTLYNHYPDIDSIVAAALERHNEESIRLLESALRVVDDPSGKLEQLVRHVVSIGTHAHHTPGIEHGLSPGARATLGEYHVALDGSIRAILEDGQRSGVFRSDLSIDLDTTLIRHMLDGLAEQAARAPDQAAVITSGGIRTIRAALAER
jgi:AcrR family transcriptional regulator